MKAYLISDDFRIVRYIHRLRFEIGMSVVDGIDGDDVAQISMLLMSEMAGANGDRPFSEWIKYIEPSRSLSIRFSTPEPGVGRTCSIALERAKDGVATTEARADLPHGWQQFKLMNVLTELLPRLCEDGI